MTTEDIVALAEPAAEKASRAHELGARAAAESVRALEEKAESATRFLRFLKDHPGLTIDELRAVCMEQVAEAGARYDKHRAAHDAHQAALREHQEHKRDLEGLVRLDAAMRAVGRQMVIIESPPDSGLPDAPHGSSPGLTP